LSPIRIASAIFVTTDVRGIVHIDDVVVVVVAVCYLIIGV